MESVITVDTAITTLRKELRTAPNTDHKVTLEIGISLLGRRDLCGGCDHVRLSNENHKIQVRCAKSKTPEDLLAGVLITNRNDVRCPTHSPA